MNIPDNLKYTKEHEWILIEGKTGTIGVTDYAQGELGDVVFVDIDPALAEVKKGDSIGTIEAVKTVSDIYAPYSGKVIQINEALKDSPEDVNSDPYGKGWMIKIEISDASELNDLLDAAAYKALIGQ
ncbi:MAG: glycine cleavage system protein GcvH [Ignavibacteriota bacterium]|jgi:glycine cleavage system H protein|nr:MAG: glycine cleavage system protein GcvH [Ignavibacterium sp.]MBL1154281.1 glycine cleavage system protein GcvH [Ignavibacteriota bacterium]MCO6448841.1 glycine cleavage system protein GcvH [Ignavibacterium album]MCZ2269532.1 glycine cleavage system protein GcvH [Ignavibacteriales bacterium]MDX9710955.1 glycine cleavage system protein GcvH [Ignavibacteriaceae bacterium]